jgi:hypothetical protein
MADHINDRPVCSAVANCKTNDNIVTDTAGRDVVVRVRGRVVPIRVTRTGVRTIVPVTPKDRSMLSILPFTFSNP